MINCLITGVGGQGNVFASKLIAEAAMSVGLSVRTTETIGMAQRGGSVVSHVRMGKAIHSPVIPLKSADIIIAFEPAEGVRVLPYLAEDGCIIVFDAPVKPFSAVKNDYNAGDMINYIKSNVKNHVIINGQKLFDAGVGAKILNVALLGAAVESGRFPFGAGVMESAIKEKSPARFAEANLKAFEIGKNIICL
ncbi:MAG: indolepyruvate oxidoreductase subunit beta [Oscillospiraceae bacterium]|nr:indolepyruvate oxidoreductase subunit beta [Oscillospiraceae bacterium]